MAEPIIIYLSTGTNVGNRQENLNGAEENEKENGEREP